MNMTSSGLHCKVAYWPAMTLGGAAQVAAAHCPNERYVVSYDVTEIRHIPKINTLGLEWDILECYVLYISTCCLPETSAMKWEIHRNVSITSAVNCELSCKFCLCKLWMHKKKIECPSADYFDSLYSYVFTDRIVSDYIFAHNDIVCCR